MATIESAAEETQAPATAITTDKLTIVVVNYSLEILIHFVFHFGPVYMLG